MNFLKNISLFFISFLLIISLLEIFLRFLGEQPRKENLARKDDPIIYKSDQQLGWLHKPGSYSFKPWSKEGKITNFTINENGSRKDRPRQMEAPREKHPQAPRQMESTPAAYVHPRTLRRAGGCEE